MSAAEDAYARLLAAQRVVTPQEREELARENAKEAQRMVIQRRLPKVY